MVKKTVKKQQESPFSILLEKEEREVLTMYAKAMHKPKGRIIHELIKENLVHMLLVCNRYEAEEEIKNDKGNWTTTKEEAMKEAAEARGE